MTIEVRPGARATAQAIGDRLLATPRYGSLSAANQLEIAVLRRLPGDSRPVRESLALLSRTRGNEGWGWWEGAPADPRITARVLEALGRARDAGLPISDSLLNTAPGRSRSAGSAKPTTCSRRSASGVSISLPLANSPLSPPISAPSSPWPAMARNSPSYLSARASAGRTRRLKLRPCSWKSSSAGTKTVRCRPVWPRG